MAEKRPKHNRKTAETCATARKERKYMRIKITDTEAEYYASVLDDNGDILIKYCSKIYPSFFMYNMDLYVVLGPSFGLSDDWAIYKLTKVA